MLRKPEKHYKSFEDCRLQCSFWKIKKLKNKNWFPCLSCRGDGIIIDPEEEPDPIEGHKMSRRIKCPRCGGTGKGTKKEIMDEYKKWNNAYKEELKEYKENLSIIKRIFNRLSDREKEIVDKYYRGY